VVAALRAGCDLLLYPPDVAAAVNAIRHAAAVDPAFANRCAEALDRYDRAIAMVTATPNTALQRDLSTHSATGIADRLLERGLVRGAPPLLRGGLQFTVVDDDLGGWYAPGPSDLVIRALAREQIFEQYGGQRVVLAFAEPRAAKGRAGFGAESLARLAALAGEAALVVLFAHPRLVAEIPGDVPVLVAWHRQRLMQEAVARWIAARR
jgi:hypothetical protein